MIRGGCVSAKWGRDCPSTVSLPEQPNTPIMVVMMMMMMMTMMMMMMMLMMIMVIMMTTMMMMMMMIIAKSCPFKNINWLPIIGIMISKDIRPKRT